MEARGVGINRVTVDGEDDGLGIGPFFCMSNIHVYFSPNCLIVDEAILAFTFPFNILSKIFVPITFIFSDCKKRRSDARH